MTGQANFLQSLGWAILNSLWQLALLWVIYQLLIAIYRPARSAVKSMLASTLLMLGFCWFVYTFFTVFGSGTGQGSTPSFASGYASEAIGERILQILPTASVIYLVLLTMPLLRFIRNYRYVQVIRNYGLSKIDPEWRLFVNNVAARMGIRKPVHVWISEWVTSPVTIGYLKPVILVPLAAVNQLSTQQMEAVLLHEISHIRRFDYLLNLILNIIRTVLYFNPFAQAFVKIVETEREKSCDEMVLQFQYDSHEYASALFTLEKVSRDYKLLMIGAAGNGRELLHRIEIIMGVQQKAKVNFRQFTSVLAALFCILSVNALLILGSSLQPKGYAYRSHIAATSLNTVTRAIPVVPLNEIPNPKIYSSPVGLSGVSVNNKQSETGLTGSAVALVANPAIINANFETEPVVVLGQEEEAMVKEAVEASRKVLEGSQWKAIEKNLADVFSEQEKVTMKSAMREELEKVDWNQWENKLRMAYDKVDWDKVNNQLNDAINIIKTDSLMKVYSDAMVNLSLAQKELANLNLKGIPDSDISLKAITDKKRQLQKEVNRLRSIRNKKIVHL